MSLPDPKKAVRFHIRVMLLCTAYSFYMLGSDVDPENVLLLPIMLWWMAVTQMFWSSYLMWNYLSMLDNKKGANQ